MVGSLLSTSTTLRAAGALLLLGILAASPRAESEGQMVLIPAGEYMIGKDGDADYSPAHKVTLSDFYIDKYEVTNAQYQAFCEATGRKLPEFWGIDAFHCGPDYPDHPMVWVSWSDAAAYAKWRGARLPTEAEWEVAARGRLTGQNFSHGDDHDSTLYARKVSCDGSCPVGSYPPNGYGLYDMTGNVCEWVHDRYDGDYYTDSPEKNPGGPSEGNFRVIRGGGWHTGPWCCRVYVRNALKSNWLDFNVGFRCARHKEGSAAREVEQVLEKSGIEKALEAYRDMKADHPDDYMFSETDFNNLGYKLIGEDRVGEAIEIFKLNTEAHPESYNAFDSLGEAYMTQGNRELAIENYRKALELNPRCRTAKEGLEKLGAE
jgi:formylglycine-generating enzyme required for sulfatase activity